MIDILWNIGTWFVLISVLLVNIFLIWNIFGFFRGASAGAPFVPSDNDMVDQMIEICGDLQNKKVYDLGCGDGRIVFSAEKKGAHAIGIEISYPIYAIAQFYKWKNHSKTHIIHGSLWDHDVSDADIIFLYLLPPMMQRFEQQIFPFLKKDCLVISHGFSFENLSPVSMLQMGYGKRVLVYKK